MIALPHLPAVSAMETALAQQMGPGLPSRRGAIRLLNALHEAGWVLERSTEGMAADSIRESEQLAAEAEAEGDHEDAAFFRASADRCRASLRRGA